MVDITPDTYEAQLAAKLASARALRAEFAQLPIEVARSTPSGYRMRCEFRIWHDVERADYVMFERGGKGRYVVTDFAPACSAIQTIMPKLLARINTSDIIRRRLFRVDFLATLSGEMLLTLVYHKALDDAWEQTAVALRDALRAELRDELNLQLVGRSKKQKRVLGQDFVTERLHVLDRTIAYRQIEGAFTQPNASVNQQMLAWACQQSQLLQGDLLELYCGNGNFTLPLSRYYNRVLATEVSKTSIAALSWAIEANDCQNIEHARLSAQEMTEALDQVRPFRRLAHLDLTSFVFSTVLVDPPRAGVDAASLQLLKRFDNILYISCNPATLAENLAVLSDSHEVVAVAAFDQFPFTEHLEIGVRLRRR